MLLPCWTLGAQPKCLLGVPSLYIVGTVGGDTMGLAALLKFLELARTPSTTSRLVRQILEGCHPDLPQACLPHLVQSTDWSQSVPLYIQGAFHLVAVQAWRTHA